MAEDIWRHALLFLDKYRTDPALTALEELYEDNDTSGTLAMVKQVMGPIQDAKIVYTQLVKMLVALEKTHQPERYIATRGLSKLEGFQDLTNKLFLVDIGKVKQEIELFKEKLGRFNEERIILLEKDNSTALKEIKNIHQEHDGLIKELQNIKSQILPKQAEVNSCSFEKNKDSCLNKLEEVIKIVNNNGETLRNKLVALEMKRNSLSNKFGSISAGGTCDKCNNGCTCVEELRTHHQNRINQMESKMEESLKQIYAMIDNNMQDINEKIKVLSSDRRTKRSTSYNTIFEVTLKNNSGKNRISSLSIIRNPFYRSQLLVTRKWPNPQNRVGDSDHHDPPAQDEQTNHSYEDILATTIINKVAGSRESTLTTRAATDEDGDNQYTAHSRGSNLATGGTGNAGQDSNNRGRPAAKNGSKPSSTSGFEDGSSHYSQSTSSGSRVSSRGPPGYEELGISQSPYDEELLSVSPVSCSQDSDSDYSDTSSGGSFRRNPTNYVIKEEVEEIVTVYNSEDDIERPSHATSDLCALEDPSSIHATPLHGIDTALQTITDYKQNYCQRAAFPEFGLDIIDGPMSSVEGAGAAEEEDDISVISMPIESWQQNWLFRRKRSDGNISQPPEFQVVSMLVPNPGDYSKAMIGNKDIDEVSELSERQSVASLEFSSSDSSDEDMENIEDKNDVEDKKTIEGGATGEGGGTLDRVGHQNDMEYTEYAVLPLRKPHQDAYSKSTLHIDLTQSQIVAAKSSQSHIPSPKSTQSHIEMSPQNDPSSRSASTNLPEGAKILSQDVLSRDPKDLSKEESELSGSSSRVERFSQRKPPSGDARFKVAPENTTVHSGRILNLMCTVEGSKPLDVLWFFGNQCLEDSDRYELRQRRGCHFLTIHEASLKDAGNYSLGVFNNQGERWHDFRINVRGTQRAEHPPEIISSPGDSEHREGDGLVVNCQVQGYPEPRVRYYRGGKIIQNNENYDIEYLNHGEWSLTFRRLNVRDDAIYDVRAENSLGSSERSWRVTVLPREENKIDVQDMEEDDSVVSGHVQSLYTAVPATSGDQDSLSASLDPPTPSTVLSPSDSFDSSSMFQPVSILKKADLVEAKNRAIIIDPVDRDVERRDGVIMLENINQETSTDGPPSANGQADKNGDPAPIPGSIADREHRKWSENMVVLRNNPYSRENIVRRLSRSSFSGDESLVSVRPMKRDVVTAVGDDPKKIDCGLKSINASRYKRDYYITENGKKLPIDNNNKAGDIAENSENYPSDNNKIGKSSDDNKNSDLTVEDKQTSQENKKDDLLPTMSHRQQVKQHISEDSYPESDDLHDSLEDGVVLDSGVGSSSEKTYVTTVSVTDEIARFQQEIMKAEEEKNRHRNWQKLKANRMGSVDSLLDCDSDSSGRPPSLPPKAMFKSEENLSPPALPPKKRAAQKHVSYARQEVTVFSIGSEQESVRDMISKQNNISQQNNIPKQNNISKQNSIPKQINIPKQNNMSQKSKIPQQSHMDKGGPIPASPVLTSGSFESVSLKEEEMKELQDSVPMLPSVKDLATKFLPKKSPEPKPRKSLQKKKENAEVVPDMLKAKVSQPQGKYYQVHSLTARSVSREFREGLRRGKPFMTDTIVKLPEARHDSHSGEDSSHVVNNNHVANVNVVYDSVRNNDMFPDGEYIRTPSPEHVGIPAGPLKMPMRRLESTDGYTSEDSNGSFPPASQRHPPARRKMKPPAIDKNVWA